MSWKMNAGVPDRQRRRAVLGLLAGAAFAPTTVRAQRSWPTRPVRFISPFTAGGPSDILARIYCAKMSELTGQPFVVENRTGAGGDIGMDVVAKSPSDGYTIGLGSIATHAIAPILKKGKLPFDAERDFTFVTPIYWLPNMLVVNLDVPARTVPELIELLKKSPGKYFFGSSGNGTTLHLSGELFNQLAQVEIRHVPYRGSANAIVDLLSGQIQLMFDNIPTALANSRGGKVRALAVTSAERSPVVPDVPALAEYLPGFDIRSWTSVVGPPNLPAAVSDALSVYSKKALESPDLVKAFSEHGATAWWLPMRESMAFRTKEETRFGEVVRKSGIKID